MNIMLVVHATGGKSANNNKLSPEERAANKAILESVRRTGRGLSREEVDAVISPTTGRPETAVNSRVAIVTYPSNRRGRGRG